MRRVRPAPALLAVLLTPGILAPVLEAIARVLAALGEEIKRLR